MKSYPSILGSANTPNEDCYIFVKYDGSNIRAEWSKKRGWYKFGTRTQLIDKTTPIFSEAIELFLNKYADELEKIFLKEKIFREVKSTIVYSEWFGAKTFSGTHVKFDPKNIVLFDVNPIQKGFLSPKEFINTFGHLEIAELIEQRKFGKELIQEVRDGTLDCSSKLSIANEIPEGVVCKGGSGHKLWMGKIKTQNYYDKLKELYQHDWAKYWE